MHTAGPFPAAIYRPPGAPSGVVPAVVLTHNTTPMTKTWYPNRSLGPPERPAPALEEAGALRPRCPLRSGSVRCRGPRRLMVGTVMRNLHGSPWNLESRPLMSRLRSSSVYLRSRALYSRFWRKQAAVAPPCLRILLNQSRKNKNLRPPLLSPSRTRVERSLRACSVAQSCSTLG